jgi:excisionase family DNA binding protein
MTPLAEQAEHDKRGARYCADSVGEAGLFTILNVEQAAEFLHLHPETLKGMARRGEIPAAKLGRPWIFLKIDLVACLRAQYPSRVMQGEHEEVKLCRSTNAKILPSIGSSYTTAEKSYREALGLPKR